MDHLESRPGGKGNLLRKRVWYDFYFALLIWMLYWWEILGIDFFVWWCLNQDNFLSIDENYTTLTIKENTIATAINRKPIIIPKSLWDFQFAGEFKIKTQITQHSRSMKTVEIN